MADPTACASDTRWLELGGVFILSPVYNMQVNCSVLESDDSAIDRCHDLYHIWITQDMSIDV